MDRYQPTERRMLVAWLHSRAAELDARADTAHGGAAAVLAREALLLRLAADELLGTAAAAPSNQVAVKALWHSSVALDHAAGQLDLAAALLLRERAVALRRAAHEICSAPAR